jgi:hypothetical protein
MQDGGEGMTITRAATRWVLLWAAGCLLPSGAFGQGVHWRGDYNKARREAAETGRPLVIDIGTESCVWCKQLDLRTFQDPAVVALLNDRCIPLKVDAERTPYLAKTLRIENYPTLVFAGPGGAILGYQEGFIEAGALREKLQRLLAAAGTPDWMARDFEEAGKALAAADYPRAIALLKNVVEDGKDRPVQVRARRMLEDLERQAGERIERARQMAEAGKTAEAIDAINELSTAYAGTRAAGDGRRLQATLVSRGEAGAAARERKAARLLRLAREDYSEQRFLCCLDRCEQLAAGFADLPEGAQAARLSAEIKGNPEWSKKTAEQLADRLAVLYVALADTCLKKGEPQQAICYLERVVQQFPDTRQAQTAHAKLAQLRGAPARKGK